MFEIKQNDRFDETQRLLYNIWQELKAMNDRHAPEATREIVAPDADYLNEITKKIDPITALDCKYCGGVHESQGKILACAKKNKKKE